MLPSPLGDRVGALILPFRSSIARPTDALVYASTDTSRRHSQDSGSGWSRFLLSCRDSSSPTTCRFYPGAPPDVIRIAIHRSRESCSESIAGSSPDSNGDSRDGWENGLRITGGAVGTELFLSACSLSHYQTSDYNHREQRFESVSGSQPFWFDIMDL